ncbi:MAG: hypothetical protein JWO29_227 [Arthrobacter sp.]|nr:hypothetical protein [Arthrobacter sp.]
MWRSLVARVVRDDEVAGSNPVIPTRKKRAFHLEGPLFCLPPPERAVARMFLPARHKKQPRKGLVPIPGPESNRFLGGYIGSGQLPTLGCADMGSGQFPTAWAARIGSGQLPTAVMPVLSAAEPADSTAGAAAERARAPAIRALAAIFFNIEFLNMSRGPSQVSISLVDIHCKMVSTGTVKHLVQKMSGIRRCPWGTDLARSSARNGWNGG